ncbi:MAG TPA: DUF881 domain-containing protein [Propionibacteriaceae bacterium]|nr:DUF881 domain-containing protein [Propionibacteriaceae bacterium]
MPEPRDAGELREPQLGTPLSDPDEGVATSGPVTWRSFWRPTLSQLIVAVVVCVVTATAIVSARQRQADTNYQSLRRQDLVALLDSLTSQSNRLDSEISSLSATRTKLENGATAQKAAEDANRSRLDSLQVLAGEVPAQGPGITVTILDPQQRLTPQLLVDAIQELRDAGAEVMQVDQKVRVVASTWFDADGSTLIADGVRLDRPIVIDAIGDPSTLSGALKFRGGLESTVQSSQIGGTVLITQHDQLVIDAVRPAPQFKYAKPS